MLAGAALGAALALLFTGLLIVQGGGSIATRDAVTVGLVMGLPVSIVAGALTGWVWERFFGGSG